MPAHRPGPPATVSNLIDRLEAKGLARRARHPKDRRRVIVEVDWERLAGFDELFVPLVTGLAKPVRALHRRAAGAHPRLPRPGHGDPARRHRRPDPAGNLTRQRFLIAEPTSRTWSASRPSAPTARPIGSSASPPSALSRR
ncbi:MarR family transcriptional regulator [Nonomuraea ferruginea]